MKDLKLRAASQISSDLAVHYLKLGKGGEGGGFVNSAIFHVSFSISMMTVMESFFFQKCVAEVSLNDAKFQK